jgi:hypothetical protein
MNDAEVLALMAQVFDRPAFSTPFQEESSIPGLAKAITDTIEALNTGIRRLRDGTEICRIPSRHDLHSPSTREQLALIERLLCELRTRHDEYLRRRAIRPCGCNDPDCPVFMISPEAARELDRLRIDILVKFKQLYPAFEVIVRRRF